MDLEVEVAVPHAHPAIAGVSAAAGFPIIVPEDGAIARVDRPGVIGRGQVDDAIDHENAAARSCGSAVIEIALAEAADDDRRHRAAATASTETAATSARLRAGGAAARGKARD